MSVLPKHPAWILMAALLSGAAARAAEEDVTEVDAEVDQAEVRYVPLQPSFVANFGDPGSNKLQFVKADVSVRVTGQEAASATRYHLPALRNSLVLLLSRQDESSVSTGSGREAIRAEALAELRGILEAEEGQPYIEDVLFTNFIVQR